MAQTADRIEFFVPVEVYPKQSAEFGRGRTWTKPDIRGNAMELAMHMRIHCPREPWTGPIWVSFRFQFPWRAGEPKRVRARGFLAKDTKPDADNLAKQMNDTLEELRFFIDDGQVQLQEVEKIWTNHPGVAVIMSRGRRIIWSGKREYH